MEKHVQSFDICIVCALAVEAKAVVSEFSVHCKVRFEQAFSTIDGYEYQYTTIKNEVQEPLTVLVTWMPFTGPVETSIHVRSLLEEFHPRFMAMAGICAGYKEKVALGDLVAVPYAFHYEEGKVEADENGQDQLRPEWRTHSTAKRIVQYINKFDGWENPIAEMKQHMLGRELRELERPKCLIAPIASGMGVQGNDPFPKLLEHNRKVLFLDQEIAAFYQTLTEFPDIYFLAVKGVCDYADQSKNDTYHDYAARVSAVYLLFFIQEYVTEQTMPQRGVTSPSSHIGSPGTWNVSHMRNRPLFRKNIRRITLASIIFIIVTTLCIILGFQHFYHPKSINAISVQPQVPKCPAIMGSKVAPFLVGYATLDTKQVVYVDERHHIVELYTGGIFGPKWYYADLNNIRGSTLPCNSTLAAYASSVTNNVGKRVVYIDVNHSIHILSVSKTQGWQDTNLMDKTDFPQAGSQAILSYDWPAAKTTEVIYLDSRGHIQELLSPPPGGMWDQNDLTDITGISAISPIPSGFRLTGYVSSHGAQEILYTNPLGDIQELRLALGKQWSHRNLSQFPTNAPPAVASTIAGYDWPSNGTEQIIYLDKQHHLQELSAGQNSSWKVTDLTQLVVLPPINPLPSSFSLTGFIWSKNNLQKVVYVDGQSHIQELSSGPDDRWKVTDLTQFSNAPLAGSGAISGYDWPQMGSVQIVYRDKIGHIEELSAIQKNLWQQKDLTQASGLH